MEQHFDFFGAQIPERRGVAWNALFDAVIPIASGAIRSDPDTPFANAERQSVTGAKIMAVAGSAGNIAVAGENGIIEKQLTKFGLLLIDGKKIICRQRRGNLSCLRLVGRDILGGK